MNSIIKTNNNSVETLFKVNDLCRVSNESGENALVVVKSIHEKHFVGWLVHAYQELATGSDIIIRNVKTYPIVVQSDLIGCFWLHQVDKVIVSLPQDWKNQEKGLRMYGPLDSRWEFKSSELNRLHTFVTDCTSYLLSLG